jgi:hypothetical protein
MTVINFNIQSDAHGFQLVDALYAYYQSIDTNFQSSVDIRVSNKFDSSADLNIFCEYRPQTVDYSELKKYQLVLFTTSCEPLTVSSPAIVECLNKLDNCYLICNSLLTTDHNLYNKVIWFPGLILECNKLWIGHFYPHALENVRNSQQQKTNSLLFINGQNRAHRHHFIQELKNRNIGVDIRSSIGSLVHETNNVDLHESAEDTEFREWVNHYYRDVIVRNHSSGYYDSYTIAGIDGKFGQWPLGLRILEEYFTHHCIIFPESAWQNNEMAITEKALKCFFAGCLPWPVGGSNLNLLYNQIGFYTAWNLLPDELQKFDRVLDHRERHQQEITAIDWLSKNPHVFELDSTRSMIASNQNLLYNYNVITLQFVKQFDQLVRKYMP